nr:hypothetical protein [Tanacetum cinerariifolium]
KPKRKDTQVPQPSGLTKSVIDEAVHKELGDRLVRAATTASRVLDLEKTKTSQRNEIDNLKKEKRRKHFVAKRAKKKRNKPPTQAQKRKIMCTYLKNIEGYKLKDLKIKEFDKIQEMFDGAFKRVNTFEDIRTELVKGKEKRAGEKLIQESTKKQKVEDDKENAELKQLIETILDEEEVAINAIPLVVKSLRIFDWKIHKERKKSYYQISMQIYMLVEKKYPLTPPTLSMMLEKKLQIDYESEMAYQLLEVKTTSAKLMLLVKVSVAKTIVTTASTITVESRKTNVEVTQAPKRKGVMIQEPEETTTTTKTSSSQQPQVQDKGKEKAKLIEEPVKLKKKDQILYDEKVARKLKEQIYKQERLVDADYQLAERLQAKEQEQLTDAEKAKLFTEFMKKRRKFFAVKRTAEKKNKPPTKAQQRSIMSTYLKNMDGWKPRALKNKSFAEIKELFNKAMIRINKFIDFRNKLVEKVEDDKDFKELKKCLEIIPDDEDEVTIDATPLSSKSPTIVDYKTYKEWKKNYFQIYK